MAKRRARTSRKRKARQDAHGVLALLALGVFVTAVRWLNEHRVMAALLVVLAATGTASWIALRVRRRYALGRRSRAVAAYHRMDPAQFEQALAALCRRDGCRSVRVVGGAGDLAADVLYTAPDGRRGLIQAKRYSPGNNVGSPDVQCVGGTYQVVHGAERAAVVTTSGYTAQARAYAKRAGIRLFDNDALAAWVSRTGPAPWH